MRLPDSEHTSRPWRIHEIASDFELEDVWALPTPGGPGDFDQLVEMFRSADPTKRGSPLARGLFVIREKLGELLGWEDASAGLDARVPGLRERLPAELSEAPAPEFDVLPAASLYLLDDEFAAEIANKTVHGILHLGWVPDGEGGYRGQLAVLVRPNGWFGRAYLAAIKPFRYLIVYPAIMRQLERDWQRRRALART